MGDEPRWLDAHLTRLCVMRWLEPDAELESLSDGAIAWLSARVHEFFTALGYTGAVRAPPWRLTSFLDEASHAAELPRHGDRAGRYNHVAMTLLAKLSIAWHEALRASSTMVSEEARARVALDVWNALNDRAWALSGREASDGGSPLVGLPGGNAAVMHAVWRLAHGRDLASPWAPLLALWERGACTLVTPDGELVVYVPRRVRTENGMTLALSPNATGGPYFEHAIAAESPRMARDPGGRIVHWAEVIAEFGGHGLGPLPGMYARLRDGETPPLDGKSPWAPVPYVSFAPRPLDLRRVTGVLWAAEHPVTPASPLVSAFPYWDSPTRYRASVPKQ